MSNYAFIKKQFYINNKTIYSKYFLDIGPVIVPKMKSLEPSNPEISNFLNNGGFCNQISNTFAFESKKTKTLCDTKTLQS